MLELINQDSQHVYFDVHCLVATR